MAGMSQDEAGTAGCEAERVLGNGPKWCWCRREGPAQRHRILAVSREGPRSGGVSGSVGHLEVSPSTEMKQEHQGQSCWEPLFSALLLQ